MKVDTNEFVLQRLLKVPLFRHSECNESGMKNLESHSNTKTFRYTHNDISDDLS